MALSKGTNSYATVAEADTYFADRLDVAAWTSADAATKAQALVTAASVLNDQSWAGTAIGESQPLAFPRSAYYFDPRLGTNITLSETEVPSRIITANIELAHHMLLNDGLLDDTGVVNDLKVGSVALTTIIPPSLIPANVRRLIKPLLVNAGANSWWRAN
jgi:hypothetical protein